MSETFVLVEHDVQSSLPKAIIRTYHSKRRADEDLQLLQDQDGDARLFSVICVAHIDS